ncbi:MAG: ABC transporter ATP-binding protein [Proteobacteria bacterium]|nr:ABC transporter ATP-binding protein [Pseudomonadota bacterium]
MQNAVNLKDVVVAFHKHSAGSITLKNKIYRTLTRKKIPSFKALDHVSLSVQANESIGIIGRNGAGKTTLLRVIAQIIIPTGGSVTINQRVIPLLELGIGFHPELSGLENCYLAGSLLGFTPGQIKARIDSIVEFSGIDAFIDSPVKTYSSGMFARLAFALATEVEPEILLLDEIIGVGDEFFQRKCVVRIQNMIKQGMTIIIVSHNLDFLVTQCNRLIWLDQGKIVMDDIPEKVADRYLHEQGQI